MPGLGDGFDAPMDTVQLIGGATTSSASSAAVASAARPTAEDEDGEFANASANARTKCGGRLTSRQLTTLLIGLVTACLFWDSIFTKLSRTDNFSPLNSSHKARFF